MTQTSEKPPAKSGGEDDEWEELTMVAQLDGILNMETVRGAAQQGLVAVRYADSENPMVQVSGVVRVGSYFSSFTLIHNQL